MASLKLRKYQVTVTMKPIVYTDYWARKPSRDQVLELLAEKYLDGSLDRQFVVEIKELEG